MLDCNYVVILDGAKFELCSAVPNNLVQICDGNFIPRFNQMESSDSITHVLSLSKFGDLVKEYDLVLDMVC